MLHRSQSAIVFMTLMCTYCAWNKYKSHYGFKLFIIFHQAVKGLCFSLNKWHCAPLWSLSSVLSVAMETLSAVRSLRLKDANDNIVNVPTWIDLIIL